MAKFDLLAEQAKKAAEEAARRAGAPSPPRGWTTTPGATPAPGASGPTSPLETATRGTTYTPKGAGWTTSPGAVGGSAAAGGAAPPWSTSPGAAGAGPTSGPPPANNPYNPKMRGGTISAGAGAAGAAGERGVLSRLATGALSAARAHPLTMAALALYPEPLGGGLDEVTPEERLALAEASRGAFGVQATRGPVAGQMQSTARDEAAARLAPGQMQSTARDDAAARLASGRGRAPAGPAPISGVAASGAPRIGGMEYADDGSGNISGTMRTASGGLGSITAPVDNWASSPGALSMVPSSVVTRLDQPTEQALSDARMAAVRRGESLEPRDPNEPLLVIGKSGGVEPRGSWRAARESGLPFGRPGDRAERTSILAAREQEAQERKDLRAADLAERQFAAQGVLEMLKLNKPEYKTGALGEGGAYVVGPTGKVTTIPGTERMSEAQRQYRELVGQGTDPTVARGVAYRAYRSDEDETGGKSQVNLLAPAGAGEIPVLNSPADAAKLQPGTEFMTPDGRKKTVPQRQSGAQVAQGQAAAAAAEDQVVAQEAAQRAKAINAARQRRLREEEQ